jgi:hypothetical protein
VKSRRRGAASTDSLLRQQTNPQQQQQLPSGEFHVQGTTFKKEYY